MNAQRWEIDNLWSPEDEMAVSRLNDDDYYAFMEDRPEEPQEDDTEEL